jgi:hypothetical protein
VANGNKEQPAAEFKAGTIVAAIWSESVVLDGRTVPQHSIRIQKRYRDEKSGEWKSTTYFRPDDLPKLVLVAGKVYEHLMLRTAGDAVTSGHQAG